ncbi:MAG: ATP-binding cassette domain-containing protein, partial [Bacillota bacterium]|nr:ATP-binding cassette domain-containing protein [Bacillota bacterium]
MIEEGKGKALEIVGLNYEINETRILNDISLSAARGEFIGLIGPNGAGKSTLLKCINGICSASGKVTVCGTPLESLDGRAMARRISLMHQNTEITFPFPSLDIVMMGRYPHLKRMQGESRGDLEIAKRNMKYTDTLQFENKPVTQLSGGERQRVLFAKILTQEADIVLLDEPTASLDISYQEQIFNFSGELVSSGKTVIAAVHDLKTASRYCSRLILINRGSVMADGTPEEVLTRENISAAYGVNILVYRNKVTGQLDFHLYKGSDYNLKGPIHVIGGGGSASWVIRQLSEEGYSVSAGVFAPEDSDRQSADVFGAEYITSKP